MLKYAEARPRGEEKQQNKGGNEEASRDISVMVDWWH
jgi:hypothetical protein